MYKLRNIARRGTMFAGAGALLFASVASGSSAFADALNPLTHRSLTLSSGSPGWAYTDGSENSTYAPPNSGANGQKTGNTFSFNVSTDSSGGGSKTVKGFSFQYCINPAGDCTAPGNNGYDTSGGAGHYTRKTDSVSAQTSDLNIAVGTSTHAPVEISSSDYSTYLNGNGNVIAIPPRDDSKGTFVVMTNPGGTGWVRSDGWTMSAINNETGTVADGTATNATNYIRLVNTTGVTPSAGDAFKIIFFGTDANYITNPGAGAFFVKINDYTSSDPDTGFIDANILDGGVTVANVMNQSIQITTKVLETMDFSVGTVDPYTLSDAQLSTATNAARQQHGACDPILSSMMYQDPKPNTLNMGDETAENSLRTDTTYSTHSYWRLSSNSSAGATVYYAGVTLSNTVGDQIAAIGTTASTPSPGSPQFGLALANGTIANNYNASLTGNARYTGTFPVNYAVERAAGHVDENGADTGASTQGVDASVGTDITSRNLTAAYHAPQLAPMVPTTNYDNGAGKVNASYSGTYASFAFDPLSNQIPVAVATENSQVVDCVTGKMRYIANIAATTPAGIYTTKINYIAAPQY